MKRCPICGVYRSATGSRMCQPCGRSYDRYSFEDGSVMAAMVWAADRARRFERARQRKEPPPDDDFY